jgi:hypothetical protein
MREPQPFTMRAETSGDRPLTKPDDREQRLLCAPRAAT